MRIENNYFLKLMYSLNPDISHKVVLIISLKDKSLYPSALLLLGEGLLNLGFIIKNIFHKNQIPLRIMA